MILRTNYTNTEKFELFFLAVKAVKLGIKFILVQGNIKIQYLANDLMKQPIARMVVYNPSLVDFVDE